MSSTSASEVEASGGLLSRPRVKRWVVLITLFLVSVFAYADRSVMTILQEPMKADLGLSDTQLGLLSGPIFAVFYAVLGIPIARLAERVSRKTIIAGALAVWSLATAACGVVGNFLGLAVARASVGGAESASPPASHSIISDYFPANQRGRAMSVLNLSIPLGITMGTAVGGLVSHVWGWRAAFLVMGISGVLLALIVRVLITEPKRGAQERVAGASELPPLGHKEAFRALLTSRTFWLLLIASAMAGNAAHGVNGFSASYFMRQHNLSLAEVAGLLAVGKGAVGFVGVLTGGFLADKLARHGTRAYLIVPGIGALGMGILLVVAYLQVSWDMAALFFLPAFFFASFIPTPSFAAVQNMVDVRLRATAAAVLLFFITVLGSAGPWVVGVFSDSWASSSYVGPGTFDANCPGGRAVAGASAELVQACTAASAQGLQYAMFLPAGAYFVVALLFVLAVWSTGRDLKL